MILEEISAIELLENIYDGAYVLNRDIEIEYWNKAAEKITGYASEEVIGRKCADNILMHVDESGLNMCTAGCLVAQTLQDGAPRQAELYLHHKKGHRMPVAVRVSPIRDGDGEIIGAIEIFADNRHKVGMKRRMDELLKMALLDPLTKLGNRRFAERGLEMKLDGLQRYQRPFGIIFLDIDDFKEVNDNHGHEVGDRVLQMIARTLASTNRTSDNICRWGGEEFIIITTQSTPGDLHYHAERIRLLVKESSLSLADGVIVRPTISLGAVIARPDDTVGSLVNRADRLMYESKKAGKNRVTVDQ